MRYDPKDTTFKVNLIPCQQIAKTLANAWVNASAHALVGIGFVTIT